MQNNDFENRLLSLEMRVEKLELVGSLSEEAQKITTKEPNKKISINEFLKTKKLDDDVKRTLAIIYYLSYFGGPDFFNTDDVKAAFRLARLSIPPNVNDKINMNVRNGHLAEEQKKKDAKKAWYITNTGSEFVEKELNR